MAASKRERVFGWVAGLCQRTSDQAMIYVKRHGAGYVFVETTGHYASDPGYDNLEDVSSGAWQPIEEAAFTGRVLGRWGYYKRPPAVATPLTYDCPGRAGPSAQEVS